MTASVLVDAAWLQRHLDDVVLLDATVDRRTEPDGTTVFVSGLALHTERRIPGAHFADLMAGFSDPAAPFPFTCPSSEHIAAHARELGIGRDSTVVFYDRLTGAWAARVWWVLRSAGHHTRPGPRRRTHGVGGGPTPGHRGPRDAAATGRRRRDPGPRTLHRPGPGAPDRRRRRPHPGRLRPAPHRVPGQPRPPPLRT
ncbi:hypothetical protein JHN63_42065, partial [Streptomyces sp. MBT65]|uniref:rhodanese-like domain-containing protein n=1 Tax=Streptomyces sp. MBT65 TaxID=1488395 RepID=UPI001A286A05